MILVRSALSEIDASNILRQHTFVSLILIASVAGVTHFACEVRRILIISIQIQAIWRALAAEEVVSGRACCTGGRTGCRKVCACRARRVAFEAVSAVAVLIALTRGFADRAI